MDPDVLETRARRAYERARWRRALVLSIPLLALVIIVAAVGHRPVAAGCIGVLLYGAGASFLWRGQQLGAAVVPGAVAGIVPLLTALAVRACGHVCSGGACVAVCLPSYAASGFVAGVLIAYVARRRSTGTPFWLAASVVAALVGTLGCSCVGFAGVYGLLAGLTVPFVWELLRLNLVRRA